MGNYSLLLATFRPFGRSIMLPSPSTVSLLAAALNNRFTGDFFLLSCSAAEQLMLTLKSLSFCIFISTCFDKQDQFTPQSGCARLSAALCRYHCKPNPSDCYFLSHTGWRLWDWCISDCAVESWRNLERINFLERIIKQGFSAAA